MKKISGGFFMLLIVIVFWFIIGMGVAYAILHRPCLGTMHPAFALLTALATAYVYVNFLNPFKQIKPFNCVTCLTGWIALVLAFCFNVPFYCAYLPIGALVGGLFERISMRWL